MEAGYNAVGEILRVPSVLRRETTSGVEEISVVGASALEGADAAVVVFVGDSKDRRKVASSASACSSRVPGAFELSVFA